MIVNVSEAKANLSRLIDRVCNGEEVVIAKNNLPLVDLVVHQPKGMRKLGLLEGRFSVPEDFTEPVADLERAFYDEPE